MPVRYVVDLDGRLTSVMVRTNIVQMVKEYRKRLCVTFYWS